MTMFGMNAFSTPPEAAALGSTFPASRGSMESASPPDQSVCSFETPFWLHILSLRFLMLSKMPVVVQYIMPMTFGLPSPPFFMSFDCFSSF
jgi:hypothetical protein